MMRIALSTSLHLDHGWRSTEQYPASQLHMQDFVPIGLLCIKAALDVHDVAVETRVVEINGLINSGLIAGGDGFHTQVAEQLLLAGDDLIGLMTDPDSLHHTLCIAECIKALSPSTFVCLGGPTASPLSRMILERSRCVDAVVRGEGELSFRELIARLRLGHKPGDVAGVSWLDGEQIVDNPARRQIEDLDELPMPAFEAYDMAAGAPLYLDVGRGCPFACKFCATAPFWKRNFRMKSIRRILDEMVEVRDRYGRQHVNFSHDLFTANRNFVEQFCKLVVEERHGVTWTCSSRTDVIDEALLARMAEAGCVEIYYGIETGSPMLQRAIDKNLDLGRARDIVRETRAVGIRPVTGFIVGYPMETEDTFEQTLARFFEFLDVGGYRAHLFTLCPFPEAPLYREYGDTANRLAEYYELPLTAGARARPEALRTLHRRLFVSTYRYATPHVNAALVDASEELAPHLVTLKALWPQLLCHYSSPLDWYRRWTGWIETVNRERGRLVTLHQGTAEDLLVFIAAELQRMGLDAGELGALVRYERLKLTAQRLDASTSPHQAPPALEDQTILKKGCDFLIEPFDCDLSYLLRGTAVPSPHPRSSMRWIVALRRSDDTVDTFQVGPCGHGLLTGVSQPRRLDALLADLSPHISDMSSARALVHGLVIRGLLAVEAATAEASHDR